MEFTFTRPGLPPMDIAGELRSDQPILCLDRAIAFLYGAAEAMEDEIRLCPDDIVRRNHVQNLRAQVREIQEEVEALRRE